MLNKWIKILIAVAALIALLILVTFFGLLNLRKSFSPGTSPVVDITSPSPDTQIETNTPFILQAAARDPDGVVKMEFWLDQSLTKVQESPWENGITPLPAAADLRIGTPGLHELVVRAFDSQGNSGQTARSLIVAQGTDPGKAKFYEVQEGDTLESISQAHGLTTDELAAANPGIDEDDLVVGGAISVPPPPPDSEGPSTEAPDTTASVFVETIPDFLPPLEDTRPVWILALRHMINPPIFPSMFLDFALLEVDRAYDGVFCYVSAGDMPVLRVPGGGFMSRLDGNLWDISAWFSGESALPVISDSGEMRLRMNCMGFNSSPAGGTAYNLGTLDITRPPSDSGTMLVNERVSGPDGWFRVQFSLEGLSSGDKKGSWDEDYTLQLTWVRRGTGEVPEIPASHVLLNWQFADDGVVISAMPFEYFLLYRDGEIIGRMSASATNEILWDTNGETGNCDSLTEVFIEGYPGIPGPDGFEPLRSNSVFFYGYCPPSWRHVVVTIKKFSFLDLHCLDHTPCTRGSMEEPAEVLESREDWLPSNVENYGPGCYGGVNVNGTRIWDIASMCPITAPYRIKFFANPPTADLGLSPDSSITITSTMWDYDVLYSSDEMCPGTINFSPIDLQNIERSGNDLTQVYVLRNDESICTIMVEIKVDEMDGPRPPTIIP